MRASERMTIPRFFVAPESIRPDGQGFAITLEGDEAHHAVRVLRLKAGDRLTLLDGLGHEYHGVVHEVRTGTPRGQAPEIVALAEEKRTSLGEPPFALTLIQALPKGEKMEYIVQKGTEIGITRFLPVVSERVIVKYTAEKARERQKRWARVAREAAKQSERGRVPQVEPVTSLVDAVQHALGAGDVVLAFWEDATAPLKAFLRGLQPNANRPDLDPDDRAMWRRPISLVIGPEGGFADHEAHALAEAGCTLLSLGPRLLRTETAGPVAAAIVLYELGL